MHRTTRANAESDFEALVGPKNGYSFHQVFLISDNFGHVTIDEKIVILEAISQKVERCVDAILQKSRMCNILLFWHMMFAVGLFDSW